MAGEEEEEEERSDWSSREESDSVPSSTDSMR